MTLPLPLHITEDSTTSVRIRNKSERSAIEDDGFPFEEFSDVAELESWRKEIDRPLYHMHKWWAQRLGSVFRAIVIGALTPAETDVKASFHLPGKEKVQCLYYFWVKVLDCPNCKEAVDLFNSYVFARHADPRRYPIAQAVCPSCGALNQTRYDADEVTCDACHHVYDPNRAPANGAKVTCPHCRHVFPAAKVAREAGRPPEHRLYAKLVLTASGEKRYLPADDFDRARYREAVARPVHLSVLGRAGIQQHVCVLQGRGNGRSQAHVLAPHPETRTHPPGGQSLGHTQEFGRVLDLVREPGLARHRLL